MDRMSPLDTCFLHVEDDADHMHIGSVGLFEGPPPSAQELRATIAAKLDDIPRYRQRVTTVPLGAGRPVWSDDPHFNIDYHVRQTALPRPGGTEELRNLVARVMGQQLDRRRPLWETWFVEGLEGDRWAMVSKVHHCMVDGIAGTDLLAAVLDVDGGAAAPPPPPEWSPEAPPARWRLFADAARTVAATGVRSVGAPFSVAPRQGARFVLDAARGTRNLAALLRPMPATSLTGAIGPNRRWAGARVDLADAKRVRAELGGTVNDVVLALIAAGYRQLLERRGELRAETEVRTMVPVSMRTPAQRGEVNNLVTAVFARLPVGIEDPVERYAAIRDELTAAKASGEQTAVAGLVGLSGALPPLVVATGLRATTRLVQRRGQRLVTTVTTNVPGPQLPLYLLGRRMLEAYPFVPIGEGLRTGVAIFSYDGMLTFGATGDYDTTADLHLLTGGIEAGMDDLLAVVGAGGVGAEAGGTGAEAGAGASDGERAAVR